MTTTQQIEIAYTAPDYFGCYGPIGQPVTEYYSPCRTQVMGALWLAECGYALECHEQTIVDLCLAGW